MMPTEHRVFWQFRVEGTCVSQTSLDLEVLPSKLVPSTGLDLREYLRSHESQLQWSPSTHYLYFLHRRPGPFKSITVVGPNNGKIPLFYSFSGKMKITKFARFRYSTRNFSETYRNFYFISRLKGLFNRNYIYFDCSSFLY